MFLAVLGGGIASILLAFIGFGIGIWGVIKLVKNKAGEQVGGSDAETATR